MIIFPNRLYFVSLFFSILLSIPIHSEHMHVKHSAFGDHSRSVDFCRHRSSPDFSHDSSWNNVSDGRSSVCKDDFAAYNVQDFHNHFARGGYTEKEILNNRCLYMFDDFVKFAQTYSSYTSTIKELHVALKKLNFLQKVYYMFKGTYCTGLQKRIHYLYHELNTLKDETISGMPVLRDISLTTHQAQMDEYTAYAMCIKRICLCCLRLLKSA